MQAQDLQESTKNTTNQLDAKALSRLEELMNEVGSSGDYFKIQDGQSQEVIFDLQNTIGIGPGLLQHQKERRKLPGSISPYGTLGCRRTSFLNCRTDG
jgi:hypothetical protein